MKVYLFFGLVVVLYSFASPIHAQPVFESDVPVVSSFRMPIGAATGDNLDLLIIDSFTSFNYPKIRFNENGNGTVDPNEWYVATAFNRHRYLNRGWGLGPSPNRDSLYSDFNRPLDGPDQHPGEDWNLTSGGNNDAGESVHAIADGVVLFVGCAYGNTVILAHKTLQGELVTSFYGHMRLPAIMARGQPVQKGQLIGYVGRTDGRDCMGSITAHLHFEIRKGSMVKVDPVTSAVSLAYPAAMWPARNQARNGDNGSEFISNNYYKPSRFLKSFSNTATGSIRVLATTNGLPFSGAIDYNIVGPGRVLIRASVPDETLNLPPGAYTLVHHDGGPANAVLESIGPSTIQTLAAGGTITFTLHFATPFSTAELVPYAASGYRYLVVSQSDAAPVGVEDPGFDDSAWNVGAAAFGFSRSYCSVQSTVRTLWPENTRLLIRRDVDIPAFARNVRIRVMVDNDVEAVFFNGAQISNGLQHAECAVFDNYEIAVPQSLVQSGSNLVVFKLLDRGFETFFDTRVLAEVPDGVQ